MPRRSNRQPQTLQVQASVTIPDLTNLDRMTFPQWSSIMQEIFRFGKDLSRQTKNYQLLVGRAFHAGHTKFRRSAEREATRIGFAVGTLYNWSSVASRIPRQLDDLDLTFEDYRAIATLENDEERITWARKKIAEEWSGRELMQRITEHRRNQIATATAASNDHSAADETETPRAVHASANLANETLTLQSPHAARSVQVFAQLVVEWQRAAERLQERGDLSIADAYFDCAAQLREVLE